MDAIASIIYFILILFFILCKSTLQSIKISHSEIFEKFQCENFNEIFTPRKFHEILHLYLQRCFPGNVHTVIVCAADGCTEIYNSKKTLIKSLFHDMRCLKAVPSVPVPRRPSPTLSVAPFLLRESRQPHYRYLSGPSVPSGFRQTPLHGMTMHVRTVNIRFR